MKKISGKTFNELVQVYGVINEICNDYSRMTDMYSLASGDELFENTPEDIKKMIEERQKFFNIRNKIREEIKQKILQDYE